MPFLSKFHNVTITGGTFTDVQGDFVQINRGRDAEFTSCTRLSRGVQHSIRGNGQLAIGAPGSSFCEISMDRIETAMDGKRGRVIWVHGPAGAGKTAVAQTIAGKCADVGYILQRASFFSSRGHAKRNSIYHTFSYYRILVHAVLPRRFGSFVLGNFMKDPSVVEGSTGI